MADTLQEISPWISTYLPLTSTIVVGGASVVLVWLTSRYVRLTGRLVEESQRSREPSVTIDFESPDSSLRLALENHGGSPAKNVRITVLKDVEWLRTGKASAGFAEVAPIREGVSYLTPSRKLKYYLGVPSWKDTPDEQMNASFRVTYENDAGKEYSRVVDFDFGQMREVLFESFKDSNLAVAEAIRNAERDRRSHEQTSQMWGMFRRPKTKQCPMCAEMIPDEAKKCSQCHEILET
ncbi:MAG TPA: hypothetical protein VM487_21180 [Phycisphaerae bacterium]|nr:hypothetical protein [Phycisphaerae bacterium]